MKRRNFPRSAVLQLTSLLLCIVTPALHSVHAAELQGSSDAERFVLEKVRKGREADLEDRFPSATFPASKRTLSWSFIARLLTSRDLKLNGSQGIWIAHGVITGNLELSNADVPQDVVLENCIFDGPVDLTGSHFAKSLFISDSIFKSWVNFSRGIVGVDFVVERSTFGYGEAQFGAMRVGRNFRIEGATFNPRIISFARTSVGGDFSAGNSTFKAESVSFDDMQVGGSFSAQHCAFNYDQASFPEVTPPVEGARVSFDRARFGDCFLNGSGFNKVSTISFAGMQADLISVDGVFSITPAKINLQRMSFKRVSPVNVDQLSFLLSNYNAEFYTDVESWFRAHGYPDESDKIYIAKRRAERSENCTSIWRQCYRGAWAWSLFQDLLAGYGKRLQNLLYWSVGFLIIGMLVFRSEKGMRIQDEREAPHYAGRYNAFWYSLDLFLPIIKLGEADVWTPKDDRRWANLYRKVHIIIGSLFVPIGLAAWTGIIK